MTKKQKLAKIKGLRLERNKLWREFNRLPRKDSFSGLQVGGELNRVQGELDELEGDHPSKRYSFDVELEVR